MAISAAVLVGDVADRILPKLAERARTLVIKNGMELDAEMGPIVTKDARDRNDAYDRGARTASASARNASGLPTWLFYLPWKF